MQKAEEGQYISPKHGSKSNINRLGIFNNTDKLRIDNVPAGIFMNFAPGPMNQPAYATN